MGANSSVVAAVSNGDIVLLKTLLSEQSNNDLEGALLLAVANKTLPIQKTQCVADLLVQHGADVNFCDESGWTCLHHACHVDNLELLPFLLSNGANVTRDIYGFLPQDYINYDCSKDRLKNYDTLRDKTADNGYYLHVPSVVEAGSSISVCYETPRGCFEGGYIQLVYCNSKESLPDEIYFGDHVNIPINSDDVAEKCIKFETIDLPQPIICRFLYVHADKRKMSRRVVASSGPVVVKLGATKYSFTVGGITFFHSLSVLQGKNFSTPEECRDFLDKYCANTATANSDTGDDVKDDMMGDNNSPEEITQEKQLTHEKQCSLEATSTEDSQLIVGCIREARPRHSGADNQRSEFEMQVASVVDNQHST